MATEDLTVRWERPPPRPALPVNASVEAEEAQALLEAYDIDFETRPGHGPAVELEWNGQTFTDLFGVADFLAMAGRVVPSLRKTGHRRRDEAVPGTRIPLGERPAKGADMNPSPTKLIAPRAGPDESRRATGPVEIVPAEQRDAR